MEDKIEGLVNECKQIEVDSTQTAETHHIIAHKASRRSFWLKFIPAIITVISACFLLAGSDKWVAWITAISGIVTVSNILLKCDEKAREHLFAAKNFTVLKHQARALHKTFKNFIDEKDFYHEVRALRDNYNLLVQYTPPTDDEKAYNKACERIKKGVHKNCTE
jgi:hypothetical protein